MDRGRDQMVLAVGAQIIISRTVGERKNAYFKLHECAEMRHCCP
jgi:hypothetical protein